MKLTQQASLAGLPAYRVRTLLRATGKNIVWPLSCYAAYATPTQTLNVMSSLVAAGQLQQTNDLGHMKFFRRTSQGTALANAVVPAPLTVPEALSIVGLVIEFLRARREEDDETEGLEVAELHIIGELVSGKGSVPYVELGVVLRYRMGVLNVDLDNPYNIDAAAADRFLAHLEGLHPSVCVRRMPAAAAPRHEV